MPAGKVMKDGRRKKGPRRYFASSISKGKVPKATKDLRERPASSGSCASEELVRQRTSPCWIDGPLTDRNFFCEYAPKNGDMVEVIPRHDGVDAAALSCEVVHAEKVG